MIADLIIPLMLVSLVLIVISTGGKISAATAAARAREKAQYWKAKWQSSQRLGALRAGHAHRTRNAAIFAGAIIAIVAASVVTGVAVYLLKPTTGNGTLPLTTWTQPKFFDPLANVTIPASEVSVQLYAYNSVTQSWQGAAVYNGIGSGLTATMFTPTASNTKWTSFGLYMQAIDPGTSAGPFNDGNTRTYYSREAAITSMGIDLLTQTNVFNIYQKPTIATKLATTACVNDTYTVVSAGAPLKASNAAASNLSISILMSQNRIQDQWAAWVPYYDTINMTNWGLTLSVTTNCSTAVKLSADVNAWATCENSGISVTKLLPVSQTATVDYFQIPGIVYQAGGILNIYWNNYYGGTAKTDNLGIVLAPAMKFSPASVPTGGTTP